MSECVRACVCAQTWIERTDLSSMGPDGRTNADCPAGGQTCWPSGRASGSGPLACVVPRRASWPQPHQLFACAHRFLCGLQLAGRAHGQRKACVRGQTTLERALPAPQRGRQNQCNAAAPPLAPQVASASQSAKVQAPRPSSPAPAKLVRVRASPQPAPTWLPA